MAHALNQDIIQVEHRNSSQIEYNRVLIKSVAFWQNWSSLPGVFCSLQSRRIQTILINCKNKLIASKEDKDQ